MGKIKMNYTAFDKIGKRDLVKGSIHDLGDERNKMAVENGYATWVEETKIEVAKPIQSEKKEGTPKKTTTSVKGKKIETK